MVVTHSPSDIYLPIHLPCWLLAFSDYSSFPYPSTTFYDWHPLPTFLLPSLGFGFSSSFSPRPIFHLSYDLSSCIFLPFIFHLPQSFHLLFSTSHFLSSIFHHSSFFIFLHLFSSPFFLLLWSCEFSIFPPSVLYPPIFRPLQYAYMCIDIRLP